MAFEESAICLRQRHYEDMNVHVSRGNTTISIYAIYSFQTTRHPPYLLPTAPTSENLRFTHDRRRVCAAFHSSCTSHGISPSLAAPLLLAPPPRLSSRVVLLLYERDCPEPAYSVGGLEKPRTRSPCCVSPPRSKWSRSSSGSTRRFPP
jgi:hypothetical protein